MRMDNNGMFTSNRDDWETPDYFFQYWNMQYDFDLDACANDHNHKCQNFFSTEQDALQQKWFGNVWMNPPYGRAIKAFIKKAYESVKNGDCKCVVCLVPVRTDTQWWWEYVVKGEIHFIRKRIRFVGGDQLAPFPSAVVIFR